MNKPAVIDDYLREFAGSGKVFIAADLPDNLAWGAVGECYANCLLAALESKGEYLYCEGIGFYRDEAFAHAWLTDKNQEFAFDLTWRAEHKITKQMVGVPAIYKGHVLDLEACKRYVLSTHLAGVVCNRMARPRLYKAVLKASNI